MIATDILNQQLSSEKSSELQSKTPSMKNHRIYKANLNNHTLKHEINKKRNAKEWTWYSFDFLIKGDTVLRQQRMILNFSKNIQKLELVYFTSAVTNSGFNHLSSGLERLACLREFRLRLSPCLSVTDKGLYYLGRSLKQLRNLKSVSLSFRGRFHITDKGILNLSKGLRTLGSLQNLDLCFFACHKITDVGVNSLSEGLKDLKCLEKISLDFSKCGEIMDRGMKCLEKLLKRLGNMLRKVQLELGSLKSEK